MAAAKRDAEGSRCRDRGRSAGRCLRALFSRSIAGPRADPHVRRSGRQEDPLSGRLAAAVFQAAGASPVSIPFSEVYGALEKGIVDAADASAYVNNDATGLHDVAPYPLYPGIHSMPSMQFTINKAKWDALSPEDQKALRDWWYEAMFAMAAEVDKKDQELAARDGAGEKIEVINWAQEDRDQLREIARKEWENYAQKSDLAKEALDANLSYMTEIGLFKTRTRPVTRALAFHLAR